MPSRPNRVVPAVILPQWIPKTEAFLAAGLDRPVITIGGVTATVTSAGLVAPGEFQFNVVVPPSLTSGDQPVVAMYNGLTTQTGTSITVQQ